MEDASRNWSPDDPDLANRSLPAKSSKLTLPRITVPCNRLVHSMLILTMRCERLLRSFMRVELVCLEWRPRRKRSDNWAAVVTGQIRDPCTQTMPRLSFLISNFTYWRKSSKSFILLIGLKLLTIVLLQRDLHEADRSAYRYRVPALNTILGHQIGLDVQQLVEIFVQKCEGLGRVEYRHLWWCAFYRCPSVRRRKCRRYNRQRPTARGSVMVRAEVKREPSVFIV